MRSWSQQQWNRVLTGVLLAGSLFIWATRLVAPHSAADLTQVPAEAALPAPQPGHLAPPFRLQTLDGSMVSLADLKGSVVLINVWASWCGPCRSEMPAIESAYVTYREQGFIVAAVNLCEDRETVAAFLRTHKLTFPALLDLDGKVSTAYRSHALPSSFFVDRQGVIRAAYRGPMPRSVITGTVEQLLREPQHTGLYEIPPI